MASDKPFTVVNFFSLVTTRRPTQPAGRIDLRILAPSPKVLRPLLLARCFGRSIYSLPTPLYAVVRFVHFFLDHRGQLALRCSPHRNRPHQSRPVEPDREDRSDGAELQDAGRTLQESHHRIGPHGPF